MGRIVSNFYISLDGVVEAPEHWHFDWFNDEMAAAVSADAASTSAFLMGRTMYDMWSTYWPGQLMDYPDGVQPTAHDFAGFINAIPKYVVSTTLTNPTWQNSTVVPPDPAAIRDLKASVDGTIAMSGSASTVRWLLANGLLDELRLMVHPVVVGSGARLFGGGEMQALRLADHNVFRTGVLHLAYVPA